MTQQEDFCDSNLLDSLLHQAAERFDSLLHHAAERFYSPLHHAAERFDSPLHNAAGSQTSIQIIPRILNQIFKKLRI
jgi:hypothetical protein